MVGDQIRRVHGSCGERYMITGWSACSGGLEVSWWKD